MRFLLLVGILYFFQCFIFLNSYRRQLQVLCFSQVLERWNTALALSSPVMDSCLQRFHAISREASQLKLEECFQNGFCKLAAKIAAS